MGVRPPTIVYMKTARLTALLLTALILPGGILLLAPTAYRAVCRLRKTRVRSCSPA